MVFIIFQLICLVIFFSAIEILVKNKIAKGILRVIGITCLLIEVSAVLMADSLVDYKYYMHINPSIIMDKAGFFIMEGTALMLVGLILYFLLRFINNKMSAFISSKLLPISLIIVCIVGLSMENGIIYNIKNIQVLHAAKLKSFDDAIDQLGFQNFIKKEDLEAIKGKNIIIIMLESVEEAYLKDNLAHLTPQLRNLANKYTYYNMKPSEGSDFTTAGVYTYLTGVPLFFKNHGNNIFSRALNSQIPSISNVLNIANYTQLYMMGNPEFAGMKTMLNLFDIGVKSEKNFDNKYTVPHWGLHDKDLFDLAKQEAKSLSEGNTPFALYISTISTHHPNGIFDKRMTKEFPSYNSELELMVAAVDKHIGDFVSYLDQENILDNTAIFILPDHLLMGRMSGIINDFELPRELFLITNITAKSYDTNSSILQIDIPKIILEGANVKTNMSFFTDLIAGDKLEYIQNHKKQLLQFNEASLVSTVKEKKVVVQDAINGNSNIVQLKSVAWNGDNRNKHSTIFVGNKRIEATRGVNIIWLDSTGYKVENYDTYEDTIVSKKLVDRLKLFTKESKYFGLLVHDSAGDALRSFKESLEDIGFGVLANIKNRQAYIAFSQNSYVSEMLRPNNIYGSFRYLPLMPLRSKLVIDAEGNDPNRLIAHAGGAINGETYTNSLEALNASYAKGYRLFELDFIKTRDGQFVASHDWKLWKEGCNYSGDIPVTLEEFKKHKIRGKYTPLGMAEINDWFTEHSSAVLVTDKVNDPDRFIPVFIDKDRLMMELFSLEAAEIAIKLGIRDVILSESCLDYLGKNKIEKLKKTGIRYLAISRRTTDTQKEFYLKVKQAGIKVFAYHVNHDGMKDEAYMIREGMDYCYGFYADYYNLKQ